MNHQVDNEPSGISKTVLIGNYSLFDRISSVLDEYKKYLKVYKIHLQKIACIALPSTLIDRSKCRTVMRLHCHTGVCNFVLNLASTTV